MNTIEYGSNFQEPNIYQFNFNSLDWVKFLNCKLPDDSIAVGNNQVAIFRIRISDFEINEDGLHADFKLGGVRKQAPIEQDENGNPFFTWIDEKGNQRKYHFDAITENN